MKDRDIMLVIDAVLALLDGRDITGLEALKTLRSKAQFMAPEVQQGNWLKLCNWLNGKVDEGEIPKHSAEDAPLWAKWLNQVISAEVIIVKREE